jgi:hypothetical protein
MMKMMMMVVMIMMMFMMKGRQHTTENFCVLFVGDGVKHWSLSIIQCHVRLEKNPRGSRRLFIERLAHAATFISSILNRRCAGSHESKEKCAQ